MQREVLVAAYSFRGDHLELHGDEGFLLNSSQSSVGVRVVTNL